MLPVSPESRFEFQQTHPIPEVQQGYLDVLHHLLRRSRAFASPRCAELAVETTAISEFHFFVPGLKKYSTVHVPRFDVLFNAP